MTEKILASGGLEPGTTRPAESVLNPLSYQAPTSHLPITTAINMDG